MLPFDLPSPAGSSGFPKWDGCNFVLAGCHTPVLEYSENFAGWSDNLTALHEEAAGNNHPIDLASRHDAVAQVRKLRPSAETVIMEIGCSSGFLIRDLAESFPQSIILGVDVVREPLYRLAKDLPGIPLIRFDLLQCPLPDRSINILVMINVLEHIEDDIGALKKAFNLLKPGGSLIIEAPACPYLYGAYDAELHHFRRYSASELEGKLIRAGFKICRKSHLGFVLFPAFAGVKLLNRWSSSRKNKKMVRKQAAGTSGNGLVRMAMKFESRHLTAFRLPFGIRVLMTAQRSA
jgi:ubiquinone/menaquinone biosynthesis C-methylase UbiE